MNQAETPTLPAPDLDTEICLRHGTEFPVWLTCPRCSEERECAAFANHYARRRQQGDNLLTLKDFTHLEDEQEARERESAVLVLWTAVLAGTALSIWFLGYWLKWWSY